MRQASVALPTPRGPVSEPGVVQPAGGGGVEEARPRRPLGRRARRSRAGAARRGGGRARRGRVMRRPPRRCGRRPRRGRRRRRPRGSGRETRRRARGSRRGGGPGSRGRGARSGPRRRRGRGRGPRARSGSRSRISGEVGVEADGERVQGVDGGAEVGAGGALVDAGRVGEAVGDHRGAAGERGADGALEVVAAGGGEEQDLGLGRPAAGVALDEEASGSPRRPGRRRARGSRRPRRRGRAGWRRAGADLGGFARAVDALEADEAPPGHAPSVAGQVARAPVAGQRGRRR